MLTARALADNISLEQALEKLLNENIAQEMAVVLENIFQTLKVEEEETFVQASEAPKQVQKRQRVHEILLDFCNQEEIQFILNDLAPILWSEPDEGWYRFAEKRFKVTLGGALLEGCRQLCPQFDSSDLILDIDAGFRPAYASGVTEGVEEIWITESSIGGGGVIEEIVRGYTADPAHFFRLAMSALEPCDCIGGFRLFMGCYGQGEIMFVLAPYLLIILLWRFPMLIEKFC